MLKVSVTKLDKFSTLVIKQSGGKFFLAAQDSIIIDIPGLTFLLKYLVMNNIINIKVIEGIVDEYRNSKN